MSEHTMGKRIGTSRSSAAIFIGASLLVAALGTYMIADPQLGQQQAYTVDTSDSPSGLAYQSLRKLRHSDYRLELRVVATNGTAGEQQTTARIRATVENRRQRYRTTHRVFVANETRVTHVFRNDAVRYSRRNGDPWSVSTTRPYDPDAANRIGDPAPVRSANVTVVEESDSTITLHVAGTSAPPSWSAGPDEGSMDIRIREADGLPVEIERRVTSRASNRTFTTVMEYSDHGEVTVERPDDLGFRFDELLNDLLIPA